MIKIVPLTIKINMCLMRVSLKYYIIQNAVNAIQDFISKMAFVKVIVILKFYLEVKEI